jgi:hypothetical protein
MRTSIMSGSLIEAAVTLAAAVMMTFAGFEMVADVITAHEANVGATRAIVATPHVDAARG